MTGSSSWSSCSASTSPIADQVHCSIEPRFEHSPQPQAELAPPTPPCPHKRGANLTIPPRLCAQEASSRPILSIPNGRRRRWQLRVCPAPRCAWLGIAQPRRSPLLHWLARRRTARDSLNGIRPSRVAWLLSHRELYHSALFFGCTFGLTCRGPWMCVVVVSSRANE